MEGQTNGCRPQERYIWKKIGLVYLEAVFARIASGEVLRSVMIL